MPLGEHWAMGKTV